MLYIFLTLNFYECLREEKKKTLVEIGVRLFDNPEGEKIFILTNFCLGIFFFIFQEASKRRDKTNK